MDIVEKILELPNIELEGLGANVGCYGGVLPSYENTKTLVDLAIKIESKYKIQLKLFLGAVPLIWIYFQIMEKWL